MKFYDILADYYDEIFPVSEDQYKFIKSFINNDNSKILDVGCATGELLLKLSNEYKNLTGIDLSNKMINIAKTKHPDNKINFLTNKITELNDVHYNLILCMGNTLVHFEDTKNIQSFINSLYNKLKNGGLLIGQILNYNKIFRDSITDLPDIKTNQIIFKRKYKKLSLTKKIIFETTLIIKNSNKYINKFYLYPLIKDELISLLKETGFSNIRLFGSFSKQTYNNDCSLVIFTAEKKSQIKR